LLNRLGFDRHVRLANSTAEICWRLLRNKFVDCFLLSKVLPQACNCFAPTLIFGAVGGLSFSD